MGTTTIKGVTYKVTKADAVNGTVSAVKLKATKKTKVTIQIPVKVGNYSFQSNYDFGKNAFKNNKKQKSIVIGNNVRALAPMHSVKRASCKRHFQDESKMKVGRNAFKGTSSR